MANRIHIRGAQLVTMDATLGDFPAADILIEDGAILAVGPSLDGGGAEAIDGAGMIALPGIIDAHTCLWQTVLRGYVPDLWPGAYYSKFLPLRSRYTADDNFNAAWIGGFEMLSYGTTTVVDYCHDIRSPAFAPASIAALKETGIRHLFTYSFMPPTPDEFARPEDRLADGRRVYDEFHDPKSLTTIGFGVESIGAPGLETQLAFARDLKAPSCIHVNETGTIDKLAAQGLLGPDLLVIHGNLISNPELERMAGAGMPLCFTPTADTQGTPADVVRRAVERGVDVVFGCDIPCTVASDTLGQLRVMFNVQGYLDGAMERSFSTVLGRRPPVRPGLPLLTPRRLIETATITAARVLGLGDRIGSLTPGKRADIVLVRKGPFGDSVVDDACAHVLLQTSPRDIDTVLVDGKVRMKAGVLQGFDARAGRGDDRRLAQAHPGLTVPVLYLLCGKIGAGKSTLARQLAARPATMLISEDHWTSTLFADQLKTIEDYGRLSARLRAAMAPHIVDILRQGLSVVLDFPANTVRQRAWMRSLIEQTGMPHELHHLDVPDAICKQRLRQRNASGEHQFQVSDEEFEQFTAHFVPPAADEGFNVIVHRP